MRALASSGLLRRALAVCLSAALAFFAPGAPLPAGLWPTARGQQSALQAVAAESGGIKQVALGNAHSAAIGTDGSLWTWGANGSGQLGPRTDGAATDSPARPSQNVFVSVALGGDSTAAIDYAGNLYTWGANSSGQLGDGTTTSRSALKIVMEDVACVALGDSFCAAVKCDGSLWTWGHNSFGQLGDGTTAARSTPARVKVDGDPAFTSVSLGSTHSAALDSDGRLYTWGANGSGQLGDGTTERRSVPTPVRVDGDPAFTSVSLGSTHSAALDSDGRLYTWGANDSGQLGDDAGGSRDAPKQVLESVCRIALGPSCSAAVKTDGTLWTWGSGDGGRLGTGGDGDAREPVQVSGVSALEGVALGSGHAAAFGGGRLWMWGRNGSGQLGAAGAGKDSATPAEVFISGISVSGGTVALPASAHLAYNGSARTGVAASAAYFRTGVYKATRAGSYTCILTLNDPVHCTWADDGSNGPRRIVWTVDPSPVSTATLGLSARSFTYTGAAQRPSVAVKLGSRTLVAGVDYVLSWPSACTDVGSHRVVVKGVGSCTGSTSATFSIVPKAASLKSLRAVKANNGSGFIVKWSKQKQQVGGYELRWSKSKSFAGAQSKRYKPSSKVGKKASFAKKLSRSWLGKRVYVQVRTYKTVGKTTYASAWSKAKSVKTKR